MLQKRRPLTTRFLAIILLITGLPALLGGRQALGPGSPGPALASTGNLSSSARAPGLGAQLADSARPARPVLAPEPGPLERVSASTAADWTLPPAYYRPALNNFVAGDNQPINVIVYGPDLTGQLVQQALHEGGQWQDSNGVYFTGQGGLSRCTEVVFWSPVDGESLVEQQGASATTPCPAWDGSGERTHAQFWEFYDQANDSYTVYLSGAKQENYTDPARCGAEVNCLTDYNSARDDIVAELIDGATALGWTVVEQTDPALTQVPVHVNQQPGPHDGAFETDGETALVCIDQAGGTYCDDQPAARPVSLNLLFPLAGNSFLPRGRTHDFSANLTYSDEIRTLEAVTFTLAFTVGNQLTQISESATVDQDTWTAALAIPDDADVSEPAHLELEICDDATGCWTRQNLSYTLTDMPFMLATYWDQAADLDLHIWRPDDQHIYYSNPDPAGDGSQGLLEPSQEATGPDLFYASDDLTGRYRVAVNCKIGCRQTDIRLAAIAVLSYTDALGAYGPLHVTEPYTFTLAGETYPASGDAGNWWRPFDIEILSTGAVTVTDPVDPTPDLITIPLPNTDGTGASLAFDASLYADQTTMESGVLDNCFTTGIDGNLYQPAGADPDFATCTLIAGNPPGQAVEIGNDTSRELIRLSWNNRLLVDQSGIDFVVSEPGNLGRPEYFMVRVKPVDQAVTSFYYYPADNFQDADLAVGGGDAGAFHTGFDLETDFDLPAGVEVEYLEIQNFQAGDTFSAGGVGELGGGIAPDPGSLETENGVIDSNQLDPDVLYLWAVQEANLKSTLLTTPVANTDGAGASLEFDASLYADQATMESGVLDNCFTTGIDGNLYQPAGADPDFTTCTLIDGDPPGQAVEIGDDTSRELVRISWNNKVLVDQAGNDFVISEPGNLGRPEYFMVRVKPVGQAVTSFYYYPADNFQDADLAVGGGDAGAFHTGFDLETDFDLPAGVEVEYLEIQNFQAGDTFSAGGVGELGGGVAPDPGSLETENGVIDSNQLDPDVLYLWAVQEANLSP